MHKHSQTGTVWLSVRLLTVPFSGKGRLIWAPPEETPYLLKSATLQNHDSRTGHHVVCGNFTRGLAMCRDGEPSGTIKGNSDINREIYGVITVLLILHRIQNTEQTHVCRRGGIPSAYKIAYRVGIRKGDKRAHKASPTPLSDSTTIASRNTSVEIRRKWIFAGQWGGTSLDRRRRRLGTPGQSKVKPSNVLGDSLGLGRPRAPPPDTLRRSAHRHSTGE